MSSLQSSKIQTPVSTPQPKIKSKKLLRHPIINGYSYNRSHRLGNFDYHFLFWFFLAFRGFIKELFSIIGWIFAVLVAIYFTPFVLSKVQVVLPSFSLSPLIAGFFNCPDCLHTF